MISVAEALEKILSNVSRLSSEQVSISDALGRVTAENLISRTSQPPVAISAMDGYALRAEDLNDAPASLEMIGEAPAGGRFAKVLKPGQCVRIFTGGPVPGGADAVEMQERTSVKGTKITFERSVPRGQFIRQEGMDFKKNEALIEAGKVLTARDLGLIAAMNLPWLPVVRRPLVAIVGTGDELVMPGEPLGPSQIVNSNSLTLRSSITRLGGTPIDLGIAPDISGALQKRLEGADGADLLVTVGGASVGDHDHVRGDLAKSGMALGFYKVAMRPGKPLIFGQLGRTAVLGLPGNPVSVGVTSILFLKPVLRKMLGLDPRTVTLNAQLAHDIAANDERQDYLRAALSRDGEGNLIATPFTQQDSAMLRRFAEADCLVVRPPHTPRARAGESVPVIALEGGFLCRR